MPAYTFGEYFRWCRAWQATDEVGCFFGCFRLVALFVLHMAMHLDEALQTCPVLLFDAMEVGEYLDRPGFCPASVFLGCYEDVAGDGISGVFLSAA